MKKIYLIIMVVLIASVLVVKYFVEIGCIGENCNNGRGTYYYINRDAYSGEWKNDVHHGEGTYFWYKTGDKYVGQFKDGKMHGEGIYYYGNGKIKKGRWENGEYVGE